MASDQADTLNTPSTATTPSNAQDQASKSLVESGYDAIAQTYLQYAESKPTHRLEWTDKLLAHIPPNSSVLELGCGGGVPITAYLLSHGLPVIANDISKAQIEIARQRAPGAKEYIAADMTKLSFPEENFGGVVMYFALFHLPLPEQGEMLRKIHEWLKPEGCLVLSVGAAEEEHERADWLGTKMFWANAGAEGTIELLERLGLRLWRRT